MNKIINHITCISISCLALVSCKKEGQQYYIEEGRFPSGSLAVSATEIVMTPAIENNTALTLTWPAANFGNKPVVKYTLQLDLPADTSGSAGWANAKSFAVGNNKLTYAFIVKDLNSVLNTMGLLAGVPHDIAVRLKADIPQYNGTESTIPSVYSNTVVLRITLYSLSLYIPGEYQGWDPGVAPQLNPVDGRPGLYEGYVHMPGTGMKYFKYTSARDWNHINYGDGGNGSFSTDGAAGGLFVTDGGYYQVTANLNDNTWTTTKTTWGIIGDATPGGWSNDTQMTYDAVNQVWKVTCDMVSNGSFKFRANNAWAIDFGMDPATGKIVYADHPFLGYTPDLWNLSVPATGNYTLTLDLHDSQHYTYSVVKN